jgi:ribose/xylose/arabinose/galactoside ABC-type transport system permease subunit
MPQTTAIPRLRQLKGLLGENGILLFLVAALIGCAVFVPSFVTPYNLRNLALQATDLLIIACGLTYVVLNGGIDFSVTSVMALGSVTGAYVMALSPLKDQPALSIPIAIVAMIGIGAAVGALNGLAVSVLKMPSFIATLGTQLTFSGLAILLARKVSPRSSINGLPDQFLVLGGSGDSFIVPIAVALVILVFSHWLLTRTVFGRWVFSVGTNPRASHISGIPVRRTVFTLCLLSGLYAGIASVIATSRNEAGIPSLGDKMFISIIASIVIGGTSIAGGAGGFKQTLIGVVLITLINNAMNLLGIEWYITMLFQGALILIAAFLDQVLRAARA